MRGRGAHGREGIHAFLYHTHLFEKQFAMGTVWRALLQLVDLFLECVDALVVLL